jgi:hypothetical protein
MLAIDTVYCDVLQLKNVASMAHNVKIYLPTIVPQYHIVAAPCEFKIEPNAIVTVILVMMLLNVCRFFFVTILQFLACDDDLHNEATRFDSNRNSVW